MPHSGHFGHWARNDTTLIDHVADLRANVTAAAELAVPVAIHGISRRDQCTALALLFPEAESAGQKIAIAVRGLADPDDMIQRHAQTQIMLLVGCFGDLINGYRCARCGFHAL